MVCLIGCHVVGEGHVHKFQRTVRSEGPILPRDNN